MIKTILVPITGGQSEDSVFQTALAAARPLHGHLEFCRARFCASTAAVQSPHAGFCMGQATTEMLKESRRARAGSSDRCGSALPHLLPQTWHSGK
jgi:hypothetical protein